MQDYFYDKNVITELLNSFGPSLFSWCRANWIVSCIQAYLLATTEQLLFSVWLNCESKNQAFCGRLLQGWLRFFRPNTTTKPWWFFTQVSVCLSIPCNWLQSIISKENFPLFNHLQKKIVKRKLFNSDFIYSYIFKQKKFCHVRVTTIQG